MEERKVPSCAEIVPEVLQWLWKPYLACGRLVLLDGDPGTGKSFLALDLAARLSRGDAFPDGAPSFGRPVNSLILSAEDDAYSVIRPRAAAAGADLSRVHIGAAPGNATLAQFPAHVPWLEALIRRHRTYLVVIDPLLPFFPRTVWAGNDQSVRRALTPLAALALRAGCVILVVRHLTKTDGAKAIYRGGGSIGILGAARAALLLGHHPDDPDLRVLAMTKSNVGPLAPPLGFRLVNDPATGTARLDWVGVQALAAEDLCSTGRTTGARPRELAMGWLKAQLAGGPRRAAEIETAAAAAGIAARTLDRAKALLGVRGEQLTTGEQRAWWWHDPAVPKPKAAEGCAEEPDGPESSTQTTT